MKGKGVCVCVCARAHMCTYMCIYTCSESHASPYLQRQQSGRAHLTSMCGEEGEGEEKSMSWRTPSPWEKDLDRRRHKRKGDVHQRRKRKNWVYKNPLRVPCTVLRGQKPTFRRSDEDGKGNPHQYSCLENPMNWGAWCTLHFYLWIFFLLYVKSFNSESNQPPLFSVILAFDQ